MGLRSGRGGRFQHRMFVRQRFGISTCGAGGSGTGQGDRHTQAPLVSLGLERPLRGVLSGAGVGPGPLTSLEGCGWLSKGVTPESWLPSGTSPGAAESFRLSLLQDALVPRGVGQAGAG